MFSRKGSAHHAFKKLQSASSAKAKVIKKHELLATSEAEIDTLKKQLALAYKKSAFLDDLKIALEIKKLQSDTQEVSKKISSYDPRIPKLNGTELELLEQIDGAIARLKKKLENNEIKTHSLETQYLQIAKSSERIGSEQLATAQLTLNRTAPLLLKRENLKQQIRGIQSQIEQLTTHILGQNDEITISLAHVEHAHALLEEYKQISSIERQLISQKKVFSPQRETTDIDISLIESAQSILRNWLSSPPSSHKNIAGLSIILLIAANIGGILYLELPLATCGPIAGLTALFGLYALILLYKSTNKISAVNNELLSDLGAPANWERTHVLSQLEELDNILAKEKLLVERNTLALHELRRLQQQEQDLNQEKNNFLKKKKKLSSLLGTTQDITISGISFLLDQQHQLQSLLLERTSLQEQYHEVQSQISINLKIAEKILLLPQASYEALSARIEIKQKQLQRYEKLKSELEVSQDLGSVTQKEINDALRQKSTLLQVVSNEPTENQKSVLAQLSIERQRYLELEYQQQSLEQELENKYRQLRQSPELIEQDLDNLKLAYENALDAQGKITALEKQLSRLETSFEETRARYD